MNGVGISPIAIGGAGPKSHLFSASLSESVGFHKAMAGSQLGQAAADFYARAKAALARFDALVNRLRRVAYQQGRDQAFIDFGLTDPSDKNRGKYMRDAVMYDLSQAEMFTPVAYEEGFPVTGPSRGRVAKLEDVNSDLNDIVTNYEQVYGILPEAQVVQLPGTTTTTTVAVTPAWVVPAAVGVGAAVLLAAVFGVFK